MAIDVSEVVAELGIYKVQKQEEVRKTVYQSDEYTPYVNVITKVNGEYPAYLGIIGNAVQEFKPIWNALGQAKFFVKKLKAFRQKVNFSIVPDDVSGSWLAFLYMEGLKPEQHPIALWIINQLLERVGEDLNILAGTGVYVADTGNFGDSMDGNVTILEDMIATGNPFRVPLDAMTNANIVDNIELFEQMLPGKVRKRLKAIFMSADNVLRYRKQYRDQYGVNADFKKGDTTVTWLGDRALVGFESWNGSDMLMTTVKENWVKLIDIVKKPRITDVQRDDYEAKLFMEFTLGYEFWADELVFVADYGGLTRGLATNHTLFYPETATTKLT